MSELGGVGRDSIPLETIESKLEVLRISARATQERKNSLLQETQRLSSQILAHEGAIQVLESLIATLVSEEDDQE